MTLQTVYVILLIVSILVADSRAPAGEAFNLIQVFHSRLTYVEH